MVRTAAQRGGRWAEQRAQRLLLQAGWRPLALRWGCRWGELDLLLHKPPDRLLLVEVKGRRGGLGGAVRLGLDRRKRARLAAALALWQAAHPPYGHCSVELVAAVVPLPPARGPVRWIRWH